MTPATPINALGVGDHRHRVVQRTVHAVERAKALAGAGPPRHDGTAAQARQIIGVHRLVQLEHHVVRGIHHVVDRALRRPPRAAAPASPVTGRSARPGGTAARKRGHPAASSIATADAAGRGLGTASARAPPSCRRASRGASAAAAGSPATRRARARFPCGRAGPGGSADIEDDLRVGDRNGFVSGVPGGASVSSSRMPPGRRQAELTGETEHALGFLAADLRRSSLRAPGGCAPTGANG